MPDEAQRYEALLERIKEAKGRLVVLKARLEELKRKKHELDITVSMLRFRYKVRLFPYYFRRIRDTINLWLAERELRSMENYLIKTEVKLKKLLSKSYS